MRKNPRRILSPQRLPFRHPGAGITNLTKTKAYCNATTWTTGCSNAVVSVVVAVGVSIEASNLSTAASVCFGARCEYLTVMPMVLWPRSSRLIFGIFASIAEFERELIRDRVRSGLVSAKAKGKRLGRPRIVVDSNKITALRGAGESWAKIGKTLGVGEGTVRRAAQQSAKNPPRPCL
jgi:hypothetical protein